MQYLKMFRFSVGSVFLTEFVNKRKKKKSDENVNVFIIFIFLPNTQL